MRLRSIANSSMRAVTSSMANKAVFFDRDGTLNVDVHYLYRIEDFRWTEDAIEAIRYCNDRGWLVIVITNQSGVARGYYTERDIQSLHAWMNEDLAKYGAHIDAFYYCPHHPQGSVPQYAIACDCRKPGTRLLDDACAAFTIDRRQSVMIGDKPIDVECAARAGIRGLRYQGGSLLKCLLGDRAL